jgi:hypothetical protein
VDGLTLQVIVAGLAVAASPLPIVAVLIILLTKRARVGSLVFAAAWLAGNAVAITVSIVLAGKMAPPRLGLDLPAEGLGALLLGFGLFVTAWLSRRSRYRAEDPTATPKWVDAVDGLSPLGGAVVAFSNALTSPKNLALAITTGLAIRSSSNSPEWWVEMGLLYVAVASLTIVTPVVLLFVAGDRAEPTLARWKRNVTARAAVIMELALFVLGVMLASKGVYNLLS